MSWRVVVISQRSKLDLELNNMVVRQADKTTKIFLEEIAVLMVESTAVALTSALLNALIKQKIKVIFCDETHNPSSELVPFYGSHDTSNKVFNQFNWCPNYCKVVWTEIIKEKIYQQSRHLEEVGLQEWRLLSSYIDEVTLGDYTNREGHAAKVYFNALFGMGFSRSKDSSINAALNYGYSILLASINREICMNGYITQKGINHRGTTNPYNLGSDLIEPWRIIVDRYVFENRDKDFTTEIKRDLVNLLNSKVMINDMRHTVLNGIKIYCRSVFDSINNEDIRFLRFYRSEL